MRPLTGRERENCSAQPWKFRFTGSVIEVHRDRERELPRRTQTGGCSTARLAYGTDVRSVLDRRRPDLVACSS
jgi:hypothetical protein